MKLTNDEILSVKQGLYTMAELPLKGGIKFKIMKNLITIDQLIPAIQASLEIDAEGKVGASPKELDEILREEQEANFSLFEQEELEALEISAKTLIQVNPIIKQ